MTTKQGWQCPTCKRTYSPEQKECLHCNGTWTLRSYDKLGVLVREQTTHDNGNTWDISWELADSRKS